MSSNQSFVLYDIEELGGREEKRTDVPVTGPYVSRTLQFVIYCSGTFVFYLLYGYVQEWIFRIEGLKQHGWYLTLVQFGFYLLFGNLEKLFRSGSERRIPLKSYLLLAALTVSTMGLSNASLGHLNYPTQVIFKSCKIIPVMIGGVVIQGKRYGKIDVAAVLCMTVGLTLFTLADSSVSPDFDNTGLLLICLALCADAVIGNVQEKTMKAYSAPNTEMVLYSYGIGFFYILFGLILSGGFYSGFVVYSKTPVVAYGLAAAFSLTGYIGILFVLSLVKSFGALVAVTVTTCRKALTMVLSFFFFSKPFTIQYVWSGILVLFGIGLNVYNKNKQTIDSLFIKQYESFISRWRAQKSQVEMV
ncbi:adenosine 3'-phospho 5'-phosphosulfate transporter 2-like [Corticium candelabrum]|uniref:adenosine 3'-phospho 5'-phosphosulfate transporter 2-like n=1 Tax=Corticium candelabrum TaxID=121492 RepID=UPI002E2525A3|nr:adenosine 3'-phospho 5'-phosphosulfate transporter 2-like [Corticium candelabrum]